MDARTYPNAPVTYGAVGATRGSTFTVLPPAGFRRVERSARIGHGDERWAFAHHQIMTWGVKRRSGFGVTLLPRDAAGELLDLSKDSATHPKMRAGDTIILSIGRGRLTAHEPVRVVYVVDEPTVAGFAYGTLEGHPLRGEESFMIERRDDNSVWITVRSFSRPASTKWMLLSPALRVLQFVVVGRYLRALAGAIPAD
ncbi:A3(2) glycogen metabolism protein [Leifsonia rubra CMS 76R]|uniref:Uncharacterized protein (UPF0548 family) n=1 Tax=Rhodoglobus vestalii TaxID=193384 RepID=A0A8H2PYC5_9MICO|nr:DUF1990 domain-containing protein [Rhodoglobus vestalii]EPR77017.1 A3(2) glycogen metabolism protein [Leifsonia rubra CMS 76R]TQO21100.1 uncharacterized protein (UPF0548 family) [Rhodoglobus vestalii]